MSNPPNVFSAAAAAMRSAATPPNAAPRPTPVAAPAMPSPAPRQEQFAPVSATPAYTSPPPKIELPPLQVNVVTQPASSVFGKTPVPSSAKSIVEASGDSLPLRFTLFARSGRIWSYPYAYVGLIENPSAGELIIHCTSNEVECVILRGRGLNGVHFLLAAQMVVSLAEAEHPQYDFGGVVIESIEVLRAQRGDEKPLPFEGGAVES